MRRPLALLAAATLAVGCAPARAGAPAMHAYPATSALIHVMGRHVRDGDAVRFGASAVTFFIRFRGTALDIGLDDQVADPNGHNWFTAVVDGGAPVRFRTAPGTSRYTVASGLSDGEHRVVLSKATEGQNGHERLRAVYAAELLPADALPERRIEYVGNSITAGYGADQTPVACKAGTWYDATNAWLAYGPTVARRVGAQWMLSAISGIGVVRNWNSPGPVMSRVYEGVYVEYADSLTHWDFARYTPDLVVVALGTNDFSDGAGPAPRPALDGDAFVRGYLALVATLRGHYPRARILLVDSPMLDAARKQRQSEYLERVVAQRAAAGDSAISRFAFDGHFTSGCDGHPDLAEQRRMADQLEPAVRRVMAW
jgi:lysophospholipase L1-like esterase